MKKQYVRRRLGLLLHELFDGWLELCNVIRRVDAFPYAATQRIRCLSGPTQKVKRTNYEANLLITSFTRLDNTLISVRDGFLDIQSMQINLPWLAILPSRCPMQHSESASKPVQNNHSHQIIFCEK
jgi:hypothetical protein